MHTSPTSGRSRRRWLWWLAAVATVAVIWGMWRALAVQNAQQQALVHSTQAAIAALEIPHSEWVAVQMRTLTLGVALQGTVQAVASATVKARTAGELQAFTVREGDVVQQGQVLARVDPTEAQARLRQAQQQTQASWAQVTVAQRQYDNNRALVTQGFISSTALQSSQANLAAAQANHATAQAAQDAAQKIVTDTVLRSPMDGSVSQRWANNGERVNVESPIVEIVNLQSLELVAQLPTNDIASVQVGQAVWLQLPTSSHASNLQPVQIEGHIRRIAPGVSTQNRTLSVYVQLPPTAPPITLRPGMYLEGQIQTGQVQSIAVPMDAIRTDQPTPYVQGVTNGVVEHVPVHIGALSRDGTTTWVAVQGVAEGLAVLRGRAGALPAGTQVVLRNAPTPAAPTTVPAAASAPTPSR